MPETLFNKEFQQYVTERKFKIYLCRKADPESKGKLKRCEICEENFAILVSFQRLKIGMKEHGNGLNER